MSVNLADAYRADREREACRLYGRRKGGRTPSKYYPPFQGKRECARRIRQIAAGKLTGLIERAP